MWRLAAILLMFSSSCVSMCNANDDVKQIFKTSNYDNLTLSCSAPTSKGIVWKKDGEERSPTSSNSDSSSTNTTLAVERVQLNNSGLYQCQRSDNRAIIDSFQVKIIEIAGEDSSVEDNSTVAELKCEVLTQNVSVSSMSWRRYGESVENGEKYTVESQELTTSLQIHNPTTEHSGLYICVVVMSLGNNKTATVERPFGLRAAANVAEIGKVRNKVEDETATIVCNVTGYPTPEVKWFKRLEDSTDLLEVKYDNRVNTTASEKTNIPNAILTIRELKISTDRGDYTCVASNELGNSSATTTLKVKDKLAAVWPFLGICAEVLILCCIIFIFEKRRNKRMEEEEEVDAVKQDLMNQSNGVDDKELRQRTNVTKA